ncbi:inorganic phosphate transporter [Ruegeria lacuscaerulensis]|uniref:inorganic phosphate transporter n=1 Tax=Ruegeria lacuscaerulensis TaxID=55218 RepID=UPI00147C4245|nr:inorganic phosphate transporter [Ruegeria lacuscaerulensis]
MTEIHTNSRWKALDSDLHRISRIEHANAFVARPLLASGVALAFVVLAGLTAAVLFGQADGRLVVVAAAVFGAYMAINVGANDVANNMGPAVGANALPMGVAITIAAIAESAGALLAGGDVVTTISRDIVHPDSVTTEAHFIWAMLAALMSAALWVNIATWVRAPVSTTHSVVGGVVGAGVAAAGLSAVNWSTVGTIALSWMVSPVIGGAVAAMFLAFIRARILRQDNKITAARRWVPILVGLMAGAFATYMAVKGLERVVQVDPVIALSTGGGLGLVFWRLTIPWVHRRTRNIENRRRAMKSLFGLPLIIAAIFLSFAHGANDVANAIGPLAGIVHVSEFHDLAATVAVPQWIMLIGAFGISFGLFLFGPRLIRMVGTQITKLNSMRAFCIALATALTVILASWLGLPVSTTHIAIGAVFGVGFFREWETDRRWKKSNQQRPPEQRRAREERQRRKLVRRSHFMTILGAWMVTVPASAVMSAMIFGLLTAFH